MDEHFEKASLSSTNSTFISASTITGLGSISGKVIKRLGQVVVNGIDSLLVRRRLGQIEEYLREDSPITSSDTQECYEDLLEYSCSPYTFSIRERACRVLMSKIGRMEFEGLATTVANLHSINAHLEDVLYCLWNGNPEKAFEYRRGTVESIAYRQAGLEGYITAFQSKFTFNHSYAFLYSPLLLYLARIASLAEPAHARVIVALNIVEFLHAKRLFHPHQQKP